MYSGKYCVIIFVLLLAISTVAQPDIKSDWKAAWIGEEAESLPNTFSKYRYDFRLNEIPGTALATIAADSKYWLWVNGKLVVFEGQLKRGPTPNDTYYDEVELASYLQKGSNSICVLLWYWGKQGFCHNSSGKAGLLFECKAGEMLISSNNQWKIAPHLAYQNSLPPFPNFRLPEHNIRYDARTDNEDWLNPVYDISGWKQAEIIGKPGTAPWNALWKRPIPLWFDSGLRAYENNVKLLRGQGRMLLPGNITVSPYFKIKAPAGLLIDIRTDNYKGGSEYNIRTEYITREGLQEFESPAYFNGHEVIYSFPPGVEVLDLRYRETRYNTRHTGYFSSNDSFYQHLWQKSLNTLNVNMRDAIQDPDRERAQWWGDVVIILEEIFYSCDENGISAIKKSISNLLEWQKPDGVLFSPVPAGNWDKELPAQMLAAIGKYGIWKYIEYSGDTAMIRYAYPFIKKYMRLWSLDEKGLVRHRAGGWDWHDWGEKIDVPLLDNAWYYMALESCFHMASHLQLKEDALQYQQQMQKVKAAFQQYFWKGNRFASEGYPFYADDRGNGLAVCAGLVNDDQWRQLKRVLDTTFHAGPYLEKYILESYFIMSDAAAGLSRMKARYKDMVMNPVTTLWEGWEVGSDTYGGGTYNHGWSGGPLSLLSGYVAGIRPATTGYKSYTIKPRLGELNSISCGTLTPKGFIRVSVIREEQQLRMNVTTLEAEGLIAFPKTNRPFKAVWINGRKRSYYLKKINEDKNYVYYRCAKKGNWEITGKY